MEKISKKNQTNESIDAEAVATFALAQKRSRHFLIAEEVWYQGEKCKVLARPGGGRMMLGYESGDVVWVYPYALARETLTPSES